MNPLLTTDFYKVVHRQSYQEGLEYMWSYWTPRKSRIEGVNKVVNFGLQGIIQEYLIEYFNQNFFNVNVEDLCKDYERTIKYTLTKEDKHIQSGLQSIRELHKLGYLPIQIRAIKEGEVVPIGCPMFEITNTVKGFGWLVNYLETFISTNIWLPMTSATTSREYRKLAKSFYDLTSDKENGDLYSCGDFSMRGMTSFETATHSSAAHCTSFVGVATIPAIYWLEKYYKANIENEAVGLGTPSMEHSVMSSYTRDGEFESYEHLLTNVFPNGNLSIVSDTYDYWNVLTNYLPKLKSIIEKRDGFTGIRGDSGDPVDIICGECRIFGKGQTPADKGTVELLWEVFGGTINSKGYKVLNPKVKAVYGDSITKERAKEIFERLEQKGFSVECVSLGIGSFTYQYVTRDTFGFALKATHAVINGVDTQIFKDPITDKVAGNNFKKSQKGLIYVEKTSDGFKYTDEFDRQTLALKEKEKVNELQVIFRDSKMVKTYSLSEIRETLLNTK